MTETTTYIAELCRLYMLVTLVAAVAGKLVDRASFEPAIAELFGFSRMTSRYVARTVIGTEALVAALLLSNGGWAGIGMVAALILFLAFTAVIIVALMRGRTVRCNCFGGRGHKISAYDLLRNGLLIAAAISYLSSASLRSPLAPAATVLLLGIAFILFLISTHLRDILSLSRSA